MNQYSTIFNQRRGGLLTLLFCFFVCLGVAFPSYAGEFNSVNQPCMLNFFKKNSKSSASSRSSASKASTPSSTFENPDFAFPVDVQKDATPVYEKAIKEKDGEKAMLAAMQLSVASRRISRDSIAPIVGRYDAIALQCPTPWKEMALLLKAKLLNEVYSSNSWTYDSRDLPADELNPEPTLWSGRQFKVQISAALNAVFSQSEVLSAFPIGRIAGILTDVKDAEKAGFSVLDFATYQSLGMVRNVGNPDNQLPFKQIGVASDPSSNNEAVSHASSTPTSENAQLTPVSLINSLISADSLRGSEGENALFHARLQKMMYDQSANSTGDSFISGYPATLLELYPEGSVFRAPLLIALYKGGQFNIDNNNDIDNAGQNENERKVFELMSQAYNGPATETERTILKGIMKQLTAPTYQLATKGQWLPGVPSQIKVKSCNITDGNLLLVPLAASQCEGQSRDKLMNSTLRPTGKIRTLLKIKDDVDGKDRTKSVASTDLQLNPPTERIDTLSPGPLEPGYYALVMSRTEDLSGLYDGVRRSRPDIVLVSGLSVFSSDASKITSGKAEADRLLYVTNGLNNNPVEGAKVQFTSTVYNEKGKTSTAITDKEGKVEVPFRQCRAVISNGNDRILWEGGKGYVYNYDRDQFSASILTDLALYHPGDSVQAVVVVSRCQDNLLNVAENHKFDLILRDANYKETERISLTSDASGRAVSTLHIPADGLTGNFTLQATDGDVILGRTSIKVAEYQAPTFRVTLDRPEIDKTSSSDGDVIKITGTVMTYSGSPVSDADVQLSINFQPWWRPWMWTRVDSGSFDVKSVSDSQGKFEVLLAMSEDDVRKYEFGKFAVSATATIPAGETQTSSAESFAIGEGYNLQFAGNTDIKETGKEISLPVRVTDILGNPVVKQLQYEIATLPSEESEADFKDPIAKGEFTSPNLTLPASKLPSALYMLRVILPEAVKTVDKEGRTVWHPDTLTTQVIITRPDDRKPPMQTALWTPEFSYYALPGQKQVEVIVGTSYKDNAVYCQIADSNGTLRREWLHPKGENMTVKVDAPKDGETVRVYFAGCRDLQTIERTVTVYAPRESRKTLFRVDTFRDRLVPGSQETWKFRLMSGWPGKQDNAGNADGDSDSLSDSSFVGEGAVIAVLSNSALDAITPFNWYFNPRSMLSTRTMGGIDLPWERTISVYENLNNHFNVDYSSFNFIDPQFKYSGVRDLLGMRVRGVSYAMSSKSAALTGSVEEAEYAMLDEDAAPMAMASADMKYESNGVEAKKMAGIVLEESAVEGSGVDSGSEADNADLELRSMEMPLAFFRPLLSTDKDGYAIIEFEVPNFNTEWNLQLLGYDRELNSAILRKSAVASKPVMVSTSMPRFLTTGDQTQITATVFNNTESAIKIDTQIEIFDIPSGKVLALESTGEREIEANSSGLASITFTVPSDYSQLGVRAVSRSDKGSDGEQGVLMVLPSSTPVSDAVTFYLAPGCDEKTIQLPPMKETDKVTLNFCNDPEWLVLTALSGKVEPDSESALIQAIALYSNAVAGRLIARNPDLRDGLEKMIANGDSMLISPLQQNQNLKLSSLNSTPWVNNAESETLRMQNLSSLLDRQGMEKSLRARIEGLAKTNNSDGSWSWMKGMPGSEWITRQVISCLGSLRTSGYLPDDKRLTSMLKNGVKYCDSEVGKLYNEIVKKHKGEYPLAAEISYLYDRQSAVDGNPTGTILEMKRDMFLRLPSEWRDLSLMNKATAAILLQKEGGVNHVALAKTILKSIGQYSSYTADKGMWFDAASEGWMAPSPLLLSVRCLEAYRQVEPESEDGRKAISGLEQYLILSRQIQDWNLELGEAGVAYVANSILVDADKLGLKFNRSLDHSLGLKPDHAPGHSRGEGGSELQAFLDDTPIDIPENGYVNLDPAVASGKTLTIHRHGDSPAWGGVMSQYVAPIQDIKAHEVPQLKIKKALLPIEVADGKRNAGKDTDKFSKGDRIRVTLTIETDRDMDYVLLTDRLGSWMQPTEQLTEYQYSEGLWFLRETRRADVNFYLTQIPKGRYVLSYEVTAARDGRYSTGIASAQSQYYPMIISHTGGRIISVE